MAEQRIAEAKDRAVRPAPAPEVPPGHEHQSARPRFSFADAELKPTRQEPPARAQAVPGRWTQMPQQRPMFSAERAERFASGPPADPRPGSLPPGQRPPAKAGAIPYAPPLAAPAAPRRTPSPPRPAAGSGWGRELHGRDRFHRRSSIPIDAMPDRLVAMAASDDSADEHLYRDDRGRADSFRDQNDYRGAHARELSGVEDQGDDVFEDEQAAPPRRADARDYNQAYREYEVTYPEEPRRRMGPFLLLLALLAVAAIAGGTIYLYQRGSAAPLLAKGEDSVPVVAGDGQPVKAEAEAEPEAEAEEPAATKPSSQQLTSAPSGEASAQRKQIYDRILGETTLEEKEQLAPERGAAAQAARRSELRSVAGYSNRCGIRRPGAGRGAAAAASSAARRISGGRDRRSRPDRPASPAGRSSLPPRCAQLLPFPPRPLPQRPSRQSPVLRLSSPRQLHRPRPRFPPMKSAAAKAAAVEGSEEIVSDNQPERT